MNDFTAQAFYMSMKLAKFIGEDNRRVKAFLKSVHPEPSRENVAAFRKDLQTLKKHMEELTAEVVKSLERSNDE